MSTQVQRRKGTTVQHSTFTGASAELTVDTTKNTVVVHDGATAGGIPLAKETGSAISATSLSLPNSTTNGVAYVNGSKVVVAGSVFTFDGNNLSVNNITVGKGAGSSSFNTAVGELALGANTSSSTNTAIGYNAMKAITTGSGNTAVGAVALTLATNTGNNTAIGRGALFPSTGTQNTALGYNAGGSMSSGSKNVIIGSFSGNDGGLDIRTASNYVVLSDGDANVRAYWNGANPTFPGALTLSDGTANGVPYLNGSKVLTSGTALTFDGTNLKLGTNNPSPYSGFTVAAIGGTNGGVLQLGNTAGTNTFEMATASGETVIKTVSNTPMWFGIGNTEQMRLTSTGLGIGTSSPGGRLSVKAPTGNGIIDVVTGSITTDSIRLSAGGSVTNWLEYRGYVGHAWFDNVGERMRLDSSGNLGLGVTPSAWASPGRINLPDAGALISIGQSLDVGTNWYYNSGFKYASTATATWYQQTAGKHAWHTAPSGTAGAAITFTQAMTLDASGNLLVGATSTLLAGNRRLNVIGASAGTAAATGTGGEPVFDIWQQATTGNNAFFDFLTEATATSRGSITYNRAGGLVAYNTTSDYRAKNISGPVADSGALIDSVPVYMGKMKGATQERPMFIAHETPPYAHTGEKDAVDKDGNPVFQQMDASALIPVMWAEIQDLRKRLAAAGI